MPVSFHQPTDEQGLSLEHGIGRSLNTSLSRRRLDVRRHLRDRFGIDHGTGAGVEFKKAPVTSTGASNFATSDQLSGWSL